MSQRASVGWAAARVGACLVLGAAVTVGAAWASQFYFLWAPASPRTPTPVAWGGRMWSVAQWTGIGRRTFVVMPVGPSAAGLSAGVARGQRPPPTGGAGAFPDWVPFPAEYWRIREVRALGFGWPMVALRSEVWTDVGSPRPRLRGALGEMPRAISRRPYPVGLSVLPVWPGVAVNTGVFAAAWAVPLFGWPAVRRHRRARAGLCAGCGYDRAGLPVCPECGEAPRGSAACRPGAHDPAQVFAGRFAVSGQ